MDFLLHLRVNYPHQVDDATRERLVAAELRLARQLVYEGVIRHIWRIPGRWENWSVWRAPDPSALHTRLQELPLWPWLDITVHPLADHPALLPDPENEDS